MTFDAIVIGAGIVGSACARECALAGLRVAIVESGVPGAATTSASMGHVVAMDDSPAQLALTVFSRSVWASQRAVLPEYRTPGTVWVAADEEETAEVHARHARYEAAGVKNWVLEARELAMLEPHLRGGLAAGLLVLGDGICHPPSATAFYLADALEHGARMFLSRAISAAEGRVVLADGMVLQAPRIVLATGVDCALMPALPIRKRKGHLVITAPRAGLVRHQIVELGYLKSAHAVEADSVAFNVQPRPNGQIMIGASRQYGNEDPSVDSHMVKSLLERAHGYMPGLASVATDHVRTGFRAATPDKLPLIGPAKGLSEDETLWLCAGFEGLGITCAPGAARLLVAEMLAGEMPIAGGPYLASRFGRGVVAAPENKYGDSGFARMTADEVRMMAGKVMVKEDA